jgi:hypothetical protein
MPLERKNHGTNKNSQAQTVYLSYHDFPSQGAFVLTTPSKVIDSY